MFLTLVLLSVGLCLGNVTGKNITSNFYREEPCSKVNGFCVLENECDESVDEESKSLCSGQGKEGAVCCKGFRQEDANCFQQHQSCMDRCAEWLVIGRKGCPEGQMCCILL